MFKTKVGYSKNLDPFNAGKEAAEMANKINEVKLGMLFTNADMDQSKVIEGVKSVFGNKNVIGCTSGGGIIVPDGIISGKSYAGIMSFADDKLIVGVAGEKCEIDPREFGKKIAREAINNAGLKRVPSYFYMISNPGDEEEYLKGIEDVIGTVPFFGNGCADNSLKGEYKIFCNDKIFNKGCVVAFFYANNEFRNVFDGYFEETKNAGIITKIDEKNTLVDIDFTPALKKYAEWINTNPDNLIGHNLLKNSILRPLGIKDPEGNITLIRQLNRGTDNYSIEVSNKLALGTGVMQLETSEEKLLSSNKLAILELNKSMKRKSSGYILIYNAIRKLGINQNIKVLYEDLKELLKDKEFMLIFSFGEYGSKNHSANSCGNLMMSYSSFSE